MAKTPTRRELLARLREAEAADGSRTASLAAELRRRFPNEPDGYRLGIDAAVAGGELRTAAEIAEAACARFPEAPWPFAARVRVAFAQGRFDDAIAVCETSRARFPDDEAGYGAAVHALRGRARLEEALALCREGRARFPDRPFYREHEQALQALIENRRRAEALGTALSGVGLPAPRRVVVVLGMHRSGSSLAAKAVQALGVGLGGPLMPGNFANPEGYFEHLDIVGAHDAALADMGLSWETCWSVRPDAPALAAPRLAEMRAKLHTIVARELEAEPGVWAFKDPRTLRFLPLWIELLAEMRVEPVWILCVRDPRASAASLYARDRIPLVIGEMLWIEHVLEALRHLGGRLSLILTYERWFEAPDAQMADLARALGRAAAAGVRPVRADLRHQTPTAEAGALPISAALHAELTRPDVDLSALQNQAETLWRRMRRLAGDGA